MKDGIHPNYNPVIFVDASNGDEIITKAALSSKDTRDIDGVKHYIINVDVTSASHPFWTGKQMRLDTAGRIERFEKKFQTNVTTGKKKTRKNTVRKAED